jgi:hypothetical protein
LFCSPNLCELLPFVAKRVLGSLGCAVNVKKGAVYIENTRPNTGKINVYHCMLLIVQPRAV